MKDLETEIRELAKSYEVLKIEVAIKAKKQVENEKKIDRSALEYRNKDLKIAELAKHLNKIDQNGRCHNLEIHGLEERTGE